MSHYVYIIQSEADGTFYKGCSANYLQRLGEHNAGLSQYTSRKTPWKLVYVELCGSKMEALKRERMLKRQHSMYLNWLITQPSNILKK